MAVALRYRAAAFTLAVDPVGRAEEGGVATPNVERTSTMPVAGGHPSAREGHDRSARSGATGEPALDALWAAWFSADPRAMVAAAVTHASGALCGGEGNEAGWYALLRGLEMLGDDGPVAVGAARWPSLLEAAHAAAQRFWNSPRLATLRARLDGGIPACRVALAVNPAYAPAQVALGNALLREGRPHVARAVLEEVREPERVQGAGVALARARVETGDPGKALIAAAQESNAPGLCGVEPSIHDPVVVRDLDEVRGLARLALGAVDAGVRSLLRACAGGSVAARAALAAQAERVDVRQALSRLAGDAALSAHARELAASLAA